MNDKNFNSISKFSVPQSWIDGALNAKSTFSKKPLPFIRFTRTFAAVASIILVCGIGIAVYFLSDNSSIPPIKPTKDILVSQIVETSDSSTENGEEETQKKNQKPTSSSPFHPEESENQSDNETNPQQKPVKPTKPSHKPSENLPDTPSTDTIPGCTDAPDIGSTANPTIPPDNSEPSEPVLPSEEEPPWEDPTVLEPPWVVPTVKPTLSPYYNDYVTANVSTSKVDELKRVYCKFVDSNGSVLGDSNLYSSSHRAQVSILSNTKLKVWYYPYQQNIITKAGYYTYYFYNNKGEVLYTGSGYFPVD